MIRKDDVKWWVLEVKKHPESAPDIIEELARRLIELDGENERLRDALIQLQQGAPTAADGDEVSALRSKVAELQSLLSGEASSEPSLVLLSHDLRATRLLLSQAQRLAREERPALSRQAMLGLCAMLLVRPHEELLLLTGEGRGRKLPLSDVPPLAESGDWPEAGDAQPAPGERLTAAVAVAQPPRFWTVVTRRGYVRQILRIDLDQRIAKGEQVIESPMRNDAPVALVDGDRGDLLVLTRWGKGVRFPQRSIESQGSVALEVEPDDEVIAALSLPADARILILTASGFAVRRDTGQIAVRTKPGGSGKPLIQAFDVLAAFPAEPEGQLLYLTYSGKLVPARTADIPLYQRSDKGTRVHAFPLDLAGADPTVVRSTLYITREHEVFIGQEAINTYYSQNVGRPSRMVRRYLGVIELTFGAVEAVKGYPGGPASIVREVYALVDELTPGRMLRSLKSGLASSYEGTTIFDRYYTLEELIATYLGQIRRRVEAETGESVEGVVLGRPVHFADSDTEADDRRAQARLRRAAEMAGFHEIGFELEPVAAALHYERAVGEPQNVVVFDFGGGTLDVTVMRIGEPGRRRVLATGGIGIAGDAFDRRIIEGLMLDHFGRGSTVRLGARGGARGEDDAPFPRQYTDALVHWQTILELYKPETLRFLRLAQLTGSHPSRVRALESLLINNYAVRLVDAVERAKITLSEKRWATIQLAGEDMDIWQPVTRSQFEALIAEATRRIETCLLDTVERCGLTVGEIDAVVRTGGSAQIPCFVEMMGRVFGPEKVVLMDVFNSVTAGLAIRAAMDRCAA